MTVAMWLASRGIIPPTSWYHSPELTNNCGGTVAMLLAYNGIIPPASWYHSPEL